MTVSCTIGLNLCREGDLKPEKRRDSVSWSAKERVDGLGGCCLGKPGHPLGLYAFRSPIAFVSSWKVAAPSDAEEPSSKGEPGAVCPRGGPMDVVSWSIENGLTTQI